MPIFGKSNPSPSDKELPRQEMRPTYLGPKVRLAGELSGDEDVLLDGTVEGRVALAKSFRVGSHGNVQAEVAARIVVIEGTVVGDVVATERVEILPTGVLEGNIRAPKIVIAEGAKFKGSVDMGDRAEALDAPGPAKGP